MLGKLVVRRSTRLRKGLVLSLRILTVIAFQLSPSAAVSDANIQPRGIVSITFDDASKSQFENGLRVSKAHGVKGTLFLNTKLLNEAEFAEEPWVMTWDDVKSFQKAGWEIGSHSYSHIRLTDIEEKEVISELDLAHMDIVEQLGKSPVSFAAPYGDFNEQVLDLIKTRYSFNLRAWGENYGRNQIDSLNPYLIERLEVEHDMQPSRVCGEMVSAAISNEWLVLLFHEIVSENAREYQITVANFEAVLSCARYLEDRGVIQLETIKGAMALIDASK